MKCPVCQAEMSANTRLCGRCGCELPEHIPLEDVIAPTAEPDSPQEQAVEQADTIVVEVPTEEPSSVAVKPSLIAVIMLAAVMVAAALSWVFCCEQIYPFAFYLKDSELMMYHTQSDKAYELAADAYGAERMAMHYREPIVSNDGKTVFFAQNCVIDYSTLQATFDLYYTRTDAAAKDPVKVATAVQSYRISGDGGAVVYIDDSDTLYYDDLKNKEKLAFVGAHNEWVEPQAWISEDGRRVVFLTAGGELYEYKVGGAAEKIADAVAECHASATLDPIYYADEHLTLYKKNKDADAVVVADVVAALPPFAGDAFYFYTPAAYKVPLMSFVEDDIDFPVGGVAEPTYPERVDYAAYQEYLAAIAAYYKAHDAYTEFMRVQNLREELYNTSYTPPACYDLYYYDGNEATLVCASVYQCHLDINQYPVRLIDQYVPATVGKVKLSQITSVGDLSSALRSTFASTRQTVLVRPAEAAPTDIESAVFSLTDDSGTKMVYAEKTADAYEVYYAVLSGTTVEQRTHILTAASLKASGVTMKDGAFVFAVGGKLYRDGEEIDGDVSSHLILSADGQTVLYATAYDARKDAVALKLYKNGRRPIKIAEDVREVQWEANGRVMYLANYANGKGDLMMYQDGKTREIDSGVVKLLEYAIAAEQYGFGTTRCLSFAQ